MKVEVSGKVESFRPETAFQLSTEMCPLASIRKRTGLCISLLENKSGSRGRKTRTVPYVLPGFSMAWSLCCFGWFKIALPMARRRALSGAACYETVVLVLVRDVWRAAPHPTLPHPRQPRGLDLPRYLPVQRPSLLRHEPPHCAPSAPASVWWSLPKIVNHCGIHSYISTRFATCKTHDSRHAEKPLLVSEWVPQ